VQLDGARARRDEAAHLGNGVPARIDAAERDEQRHRLLVPRCEQLVGVHGRSPPHVLSR
jgi:hypothetical protein